MSYYNDPNNQPSWQTAATQQSWEQQTPPARSGASSAVPREDSNAFASQFEEIDRCRDILAKSQDTQQYGGMAGRRESAPMSGGARSFQDQFDPRMGGGMGGSQGGSSRGHSVSGDFGDARSFSGSNVQGYYASQRHQPSRGANEAEQMMQAKRRLAAQREKELRNYHQEQQYNRTAVQNSGGKFDRAMSPGSGMSEEERRELMARQRSALYGNEPSFGENTSFEEHAGTPRPGTQGSGSQSATGMRGPSPLAFDHYKSQGQGQAENSAHQLPAEQQTQQRSRANSTSSPNSNPTSSFSLFESAAQQSSRTSTSSPGGSPPRKAPTAPIGTRPAQNPALNKRSTTPLPSPLSYGFAANNNEESQNEKAGENWTGKPAMWGKGSLAVQPSVWG